MCKWFLNMPSSADEFTECFVTARKKLTEDQLKAMPRLVRGGARQLEVLRQSCLSAITGCEEVSSMLDQRKQDLLNEAMDAYQRFGSQLAVLKK
jgi:limonene-1,2-epoxide hydrolase